MTERVDKALEVYEVYRKARSLANEIYKEVIKITGEFTDDEIEEYYDRKREL